MNMQYLNNLQYEILSSSRQTYSETLTLLSLHESLFAFFCVLESMVMPVYLIVDLISLVIQRSPR